MELLKQFLLKSYKSDVDSKISEKFEQWILDCSNYDIDSKRLLYCIGIDTKFNIVDKSKYINVFNNIDYDLSSKPQEKFQKIIELDNAKYHFFSDKCCKIGDDQYCGMIKLWVFTNYYIDGLYSNDDLPFIRERLQKGDFKTILISNNSSVKPRNVSWVTLLSEISAIKEVAKSNNYNIINYICHKLGLYWGNVGSDFEIRPEWVNLIYPKDIDENFYQPIAVNAEWRTPKGLYLSYKDEDEFGRTRSQTEDYNHNGVKERVHFRIEKDYIYNAIYLGKAEINNINTDKIIDSAKKRFEDGK